MKSYLFTTLAFLTTFSVTQSLQARPCDNRDYQGTYSVIGTGGVNFGSPLDGPFARAGRAVGDGAGNALAATTASYNGYIFAEPYSGTYIVSPDCTIRFDMLIPVPGGITLPVVLKGVISDNGNEVPIMLASPQGVSIQIVLRRQTKNKPSCSVRDLQGGFALDMTGTTNLPAPAGGPFTRVGPVVFDGKGAFTAATLASYNGGIVTEDLTGSYTVTPECDLQMHYTYGQTYTWSGTLSDNSTGATLILTEPNLAAVVTGKLKQVSNNTDGLQNFR